MKGATGNMQPCHRPSRSATRCSYPTTRTCSLESLSCISFFNIQMFTNKDYERLV